MNPFEKVLKINSDMKYEDRFKVIEQYLKELVDYNEARFRNLEKGKEN